MTAQVIFLNSGYFPDREEAERLETIQEQLTLFHAEFAFAVRDKCPVMAKIRKKEAHLIVRKGLSVLNPE
jgi:hypothetical protein